MSNVVLIVGATKGIGLKTARELQARGFHVYGTGRNPQRAGISDLRLVSLDVTDEASVQAAVSQVIAEAGHIDILINNAGYDLYGAAEETSMADLHAQIDTNFYGTVRVIQAVLPHMRERGQGKIINVSSIGGLLSLPYNSAYAASKYAIEGYSESLRYEVLRFGVYVSLIEPGGTRTESLDTSIIEIDGGKAPYIAHRQQMVQKMRQLSATGISMDSVAATIIHVAQASKPRLRYPVGTGARLLPLMKSLMPQWLFERFMLNQFMSDASRQPARQSITANT